MTGFAPTASRAAAAPSVRSDSFSSAVSELPSMRSDSFASATSEAPSARSNSTQHALGPTANPLPRIKTSAPASPRSVLDRNLDSPRDYEHRAASAPPALDLAGAAKLPLPALRELFAATEGYDSHAHPVLFNTWLRANATLDVDVQTRKNLGHMADWQQADWRPRVTTLEQNAWAMRNPRANETAQPGPPAPPDWLRRRLGEVSESDQSFILDHWQRGVRDAQGGAIEEWALKKALNVEPSRFVTRPSVASFNAAGKDGEALDVVFESNAANGYFSTQGPDRPEPGWHLAHQDGNHYNLLFVPPNTAERQARAGDRDYRFFHARKFIIAGDNNNCLYRAMRAIGVLEPLHIDNVEKAEDAFAQHEAWINDAPIAGERLEVADLVANKLLDDRDARHNLRSESSSYQV